MAGWEAIAAAVIAYAILTPDLLDVIQLKLRDAHLRHQGKAGEAIVRLAQIDVNDCR